MTTLSELHKATFGPGNWPLTVHNHIDMNCIYDLADAEMNADIKMHTAFNKYQAGHSKPRADAMRVFKQGVISTLKNNNWGAYSQHQLELIAYALLKTWIEKSEHVDK